MEPTGEEEIVAKRVKAERRRAVREEPRGKAAVAARLRAESSNEKVAAAAAAAEEVNPGRAVGAAMRAKTKAGAVPEDARDAALVANVRSKAPRSSPIVEVAALLAECVRHDLKCIAFCKTKKLCELVLRYCREILRDTGAGHLTDSVAAYRGGYAAVDRRAVEGALFGGALRGVAATNALSNWASTSATSTVPCTSGSRAPWRRSCSSRGGRVGAEGGPSGSTSRSTARSTSTSCGIPRGCLRGRLSARLWIRKI